MSFEQDPEEQAKISGADFALMCDEMRLQQSRIAELEAKLAKAESGFQELRQEAFEMGVSDGKAIFKAHLGEPVAWGVPNTRITEKSPFLQVLLDIEGAQYRDLLTPLYALKD